MKHYIRFKHLSTSYCVETGEFTKNGKPINQLGSDGIFYLGNRLSLSNMIRKGYELCKKRGNKVGFSICRYNRSLFDSKEIKTILF